MNNPPRHPEPVVIEANLRDKPGPVMDRYIFDLVYGTKTGGMLPPVSTSDQQAWIMLRHVLSQDNYVFNLSVWNGDWNCSIADYSRAKHCDEDWTAEAIAYHGGSDDWRENKAAMAICRCVIALKEGE